MAGTAYRGFSLLSTPQTEPIPRESQVQNNAGGFVYEISGMDMLKRFLILGSEGGSYYATQQKLTKDNALNIIKVIDAVPEAAIREIVRVSHEGLAPSNDPAIFALALAAAAPHPDTRARALAVLPQVCRIPTHLFHFITYVKQFRGLGRGLRTALGDWYQEQPVEQLAYQAVKYQSRDGWSNRDILRLAHPKTSDPVRNAIYNWITHGFEPGTKAVDDVQRTPIITAFEMAKTLGKEPTKLATLIRETNLSREMLPTEALTSPEVWDALLERMPLGAMVRNLGNMSKCGLLTPLSAAAHRVANALTDEAALKKARLHPIQLLIALQTYRQGHGLLGKGQWQAVPAVIDALDAAFYLAFKTLEPTGKRLLFALDVSGSMGSPAGNLPISCAEGAAAMALACAKTEQTFYIMGFAHDFVDLGITPNMRLDQALRITRDMNFGSTNCALPMEWAEKKKINVDGFIVITDNETWSGGTHVSQALRSYRRASGIQAKQVVMAMTPTPFSIADPNDPGTLDVVGFSADVPHVIQGFLR